jgi:hypothetical protein
MNSEPGYTFDVYNFYSSVTGKKLGFVSAGGPASGTYFWSNNSTYVAEGIDASGTTLGYRSPITGTGFTLAYPLPGNPPPPGNSTMWVGERDDFGNDVPTEYVEPEPFWSDIQVTPDPTWGAWWAPDSRDMDGGCTMDGARVPCDWVIDAINNGSGVQCPHNNCSPQLVTSQGERVLAYFQAYADGYAGFVPRNTRYIGNGALAFSRLDRPILLGRGQQRYPNDTNLAPLNGGSGSIRNEGIEVLKNIGVDAFWAIDRRVDKWWTWTKSNINRERIDNSDLDRFRSLMNRMLSTKRCGDFLKSIGIEPERVLRAFDLTRVQGGFGWGADGYGGLAGGDVDENSMGGMIDIRREAQMRFQVETFIHESIHTDGPDDNKMSKMFEERGLYPPNNPMIKYHPGNMSLNSLAWGSILSKYCMPTEKEMATWLKN